MGTDCVPLPEIASAAIAAAQLETIHPFADGNGRVGRCLIHAILRGDGLTPSFVPPGSIVVAARPKSYLGGLVEFREGGIGAWVTSFAAAIIRAATEGMTMADDIDALRKAWYERSGRPRRARRGEVLDLRFERRPGRTRISIIGCREAC